MNTLYCRILSSADLPEIESFLLQQQSLLGHRISAAENEKLVQAFAVRYFDPKNGYLHWGIFHEHTLLGMAGLMFWPEFPYATLLNLKTNPALKPEIRRKVLREIYRFLDETLRERAVYKFYYITSMRRLSPNRKTGRLAVQRICEQMRDWTFFTEALVRPGDTPRFNYVAKLLAQFPNNDPLIVRVAMLNSDKRAW